MKVVLLAGGFGTRLSEYTELIPKPLVQIGDKPILWHIMKSYANFNHKDFIVALGYKGSLIKDYFLNYRSVTSDFTIDYRHAETIYHKTENLDWRVSLIETGLSTMTGGRVKRLREHIGNQPFMLTYGDGLADIDLDALLDFHSSHGKMVTITAVKPTARFGELEIQGDKVDIFREKPQLNDGWINGGFFVIQPEFFNLIHDDDTFLEREPLEIAAQRGELMAFKHHGFWQCMDTKRDHQMLEKLWKEGAPWV